MSVFAELAAAALEAADDAPLAARRMVLPGNRRPWTASGISLRRGQAYTLIASGRIHWSRQRPELYAGPGFHLWARVHPGGKVVNVTRTSGSFVADADGELELGIYLGMWRDEFGTLDTPQAAYERLSGELEVCALAWRDSALAGVTALAARLDHTLLETERQRLLNPLPPPAGWDYLTEIGTSDVFLDDSGGGAARICLDASDDQGIIRTAIDFELTPTTTVAWRWRVHEHPSMLAEDTVYTHDYISLAAEFDNGRDLTWIWSSALPVEHCFACPIKAWQARETHLVVRGADAPLACWVDEQRLVYADVARAMGPPPRRIVALWLIVVASFQHGRARAEFSDIVLADGDREIKVL